RQEFIDGDYLDHSEGEELWRISARVQALNDMDYGAFDDEIRAKVEPALAAVNARLEKSSKPAASEPAASEPPVVATYTGLVPLVYKAQRSLMDGLIWGFIGDWVLVAIVMMIVVWDWSAGLLLMIPSVFPVVIVFGVMGWMGVLVDTGTVMAPAVALGVTVDDVVHFMLKYRDALRQGTPRRDAIMSAYRHCGQAIYQSWGVIGLGLSVFAMSHFMPTQRFGVMMVTLLTASTFGNLVLLPAVLASPLGYLFTWRAQRKRVAGHPAELTSVPAWHVPAIASLREEASALVGRPGDEESVAARPEKPHGDKLRRRDAPHG
ncbi:MAG: MMPL family transporter, partial [Pirellulales bacterium]